MLPSTNAMRTPNSRLREVDCANLSMFLSYRKRDMWTKENNNQIKFQPISAFSRCNNPLHQLVALQFFDLEFRETLLR